MHAPAEWPQPFDLGNRDYKSFSDKQGLSSVTMADLGVVASTADPEVELRRTALGGQGPAAAHAPVDTDESLGGELAAHASFKDNLFHVEAFGAFHARAFVWVEYRFYPEVSKADQAKILEEGLASFQWK
jgi:hypothetical protein